MAVPDIALHADQAVIKAARIADLVLVLCRPSILDRDAIGASSASLRRHQTDHSGAFRSCSTRRPSNRSDATPISPRNGNSDCTLRSKKF